MNKYFMFLAKWDNPKDLIVFKGNKYIPQTLICTHVEDNKNLSLELNNIEGFMPTDNSDKNGINYTGAILFTPDDKSEINISINDAKEFILENYKQFELLNNPVADEMSDNINYFE